MYIRALLKPFKQRKLGSNPWRVAAISRVEAERPLQTLQARVRKNRKSAHDVLFWLSYISWVYPQLLQRPEAKMDSREQHGLSYDFRRLENVRDTIQSSQFTSRQDGRSRSTGEQSRTISRLGLETMPMPRAATHLDPRHTTPSFAAITNGPPLRSPAGGPAAQGHPGLNIFGRGLCHDFAEEPQVNSQWDEHCLERSALNQFEKSLQDTSVSVPLAL